MPQKRPVAFSGKKKKEQLKQKRNQKNAKSTEDQSDNKFIIRDNHIPAASGDKEDAAKPTEEIKLTKFQKAGKSGDKISKSEKYKLLFQYETKEAVEEAKRVAQSKIIEPYAVDLTISVEDIYDNIIDFPKRPAWGSKTDAGTIDKIEREYFDDYISRVHELYNIKSLSYFEHNLETWRQLWRVLELSDLVCIVADVRHPVLHFPPALYNHILSQNKKCILILNKIDLVPPELYVGWKKYFISHFPALIVIGFTCFDRFTFRENKNIQKKRSRTVKFGNQFASQFGPVELGKAIQAEFPAIDIVDWIETLEDINKCEGDTDLADVAELVDDEFRVKIGFVGHTNVGKSSIMNTLVGEKHFSMSIRPGHTKELQTWNVHRVVQLVDCPGIIFPSTVPRQLQVVSGLFPIDQVREPYTVVGYLGERLNLVNTFKLRHVSDEREFTGWDICESFAMKKNFMVAKKRYPDAYRGANFLLRMAVTGQLVLAFKPPGYNTELFLNDKEVIAMKKITTKEHVSRREFKYDATHAVAHAPKAIPNSTDSEDSTDSADSSSDLESEPSDTNHQNRFAMLDE